VGCGAGNTMFPLLQESKNPELYVYGADFSSTAVEVVKSSPNYDEARCKAFVWDLTSSSIPDDIEPESLDFVVLIFVLSAIHPDTWKQAVANAHKVSLVYVDNQLQFTLLELIFSSFYRC
jgi:tRNAThr (cytosine32-N3)-methyltransferase